MSLMKTTKKPARTKGPRPQSAATYGTCHCGLASVLFWDASPNEKTKRRPNLSLKRKTWSQLLHWLQNHHTFHHIYAKVKEKGPKRVIRAKFKPGDKVIVQDPDDPEAGREAEVEVQSQPSVLQNQCNRSQRPVRKTFFLFFCCF